MKIIGTIYRKEMRRVLFDRKMVLALFVMPVLLMLVIYGVVGIMALNMQKDIAAHQDTITVYGAADSFRTYLAESVNGVAERSETAETDADADAVITYIATSEELARAKQQIYDGELDVLVEFPEDFDAQVESYQKGDAVPQIKTYYNPSEDYSESAKSSVDSLLEQYRLKLLENRYGDKDAVCAFTVDSDNSEQVIQDENKAGGKVLGMMLPYMICMLLFASVMSLGTDSITGEKEKGTLATMLVAPVKRSQIVYGKILALMTLAAMSALVYGISMLVAIPLFVIMLKSQGMGFHISALQGLLMLLLIVSLVFVYVAIISVCSALAKNMKEASAYLTPVYLIVIVVGMMTMFVTGDTPAYSYFIPLYGSTMALRNILTQEITNGQLLGTIGVNLLLGMLLAAVVAKAFDNERVMFDA